MVSKIFSRSSWLFLLPFLTGSLLLSLGVFGAYSYFSSQTQIVNNTLSFGTLTMKLNQTYDSLTAIWNQSNLKPGDSVSGNFDVYNTGSLTAQALGLQMVNSGFNTSNNPTLDYKLRLTSLTYDGQELINAIESALASHASSATQSGITITSTHANGLFGLDTDANNHLSLGELHNQELIIKPASGSLNGLTANSHATVSLTLYFVPGSNDNDYQSDSVVTTITGTLYQVAP